MELKYKIIEVEEIDNLTPGTQIAVKRLYKDLHPSFKYFYPLFSTDGHYYHHGVCLKKLKVVHFYGENKDDAKPRISGLLQFMKGAVEGILYRIEYEDPVW